MWTHIQISPHRAYYHLEKSIFPKRRCDCTYAYVDTYLSIAPMVLYMYMNLHSEVTFKEYLFFQIHLKSSSCFIYRTS